MTSASRASSSAASTPSCIAAAAKRHRRIRRRAGFSPPRDGLKPVLRSHQLALPRLHALAELAQLVALHDLFRAREHVLLFLVGVVLDQLLEHFRLRLQLF